MASTLIQQCLIDQAITTNELQPEHFGGIKCSSPIDLGASRVLFWNVLQQCQCAGGIASVDASNCYD
eukprot:6693561-Ditylum_brightwellii.AAC.1